MRLSPALLLLVGLCIQANAAITLVAHKIATDITGAESYAMNAPGYESKAGNLIAVWTVSYSGADPVGLVTEDDGSPHKLLPEVKSELYFGIAEHDTATPPAFAALPGPYRILASTNCITPSRLVGMFAPSATT